MAGSAEDTQCVHARGTHNHVHPVCVTEAGIKCSITHGAPAHREARRYKNLALAAYSVLPGLLQVLHHLRVTSTAAGLRGLWIGGGGLGVTTV